MMNTVSKGLAYDSTNIDLTSPDLERFPGFNLISRYTCHLKAGDVLYVPTWMLHEVENVTDGWAVNYRITNIRAFLRYPGNAIARILVSQPSFFKVLFKTLICNKFDRDATTLVTPKVFRNH